MDRPGARNSRWRMVVERGDTQAQIVVGLRGKVAPAGAYSLARARWPTPAILLSTAQLRARVVASESH